jgi:hypothetical protein
MMQQHALTPKRNATTFLHRSELLFFPRERKRKLCQLMLIAQALAGVEAP